MRIAIITAATVALLKAKLGQRQLSEDGGGYVAMRGYIRQVHGSTRGRVSTVSYGINWRLTNAYSLLSCWNESAPSIRAEAPRPAALLAASENGTEAMKPAAADLLSSSLRFISTYLLCFPQLTRSIGGVGLCVATVAALTPINVIGELVSIGTLLAFVIVCGGVWILRRRGTEVPRRFVTPWVPFTPIMGIVVSLLMMLSLGWETWARLIIWLVIELMIYFFYGRKHSRVQLINAAEPQPKGAPSIAD
jgi:amino acid transporter